MLISYQQARQAYKSSLNIIFQIGFSKSISLKA